MKRLVIPKGLVALRPRREDAGQAEEVAASVAPARRALPALDVKAIQRKAFERGREVEAQGAARVLRQAAEELLRAAAGLQAARDKDREEIEEFCVRLACVLAEEMIGKAVSEDHHDVRSLVRRILDDALSGLDAEEATLLAHPEDLALLPRNLGLEGPGPRLRVAPDPALRRGSFRVVARGAEYYSGIGERLAAARESLLREVSGEGRA